MIQRSPSRSARVVSPARSEPAPGSLNSWHQPMPALEDRRDVAGDLLGRAVGEDRRRGHEQPEAAGRAQRAVLGERAPAPWPAAGASRPRPPCSGVKCGAVQPAARRRSRHHSSTVRSGSQCSSSQRVDLVAQLASTASRRSAASGAEQLEAVVAHDPADVGVVEPVRAPSTKSRGSARPSPWGQSEPNRMRSTPIRSASACRSSS